ncbi:c-type cytochrome [Leeuwenhoekiella nanhaiensis]|uniref:Diheme cytochrome c-553 n=1 Tax=Leeuwenhoekiella nanhaiensis TaxID=1655491 RepID=A0A2G1VRI1_9FLAO|nr:c-type cytochrome [Leeuwenhoekiella nanhaiensis]PHQ29387.1 diheme cytochrome c-553 [Leeuwenhoekiella nanhaiensis]
MKPQLIWLCLTTALLVTACKDGEAKKEKEEYQIQQAGMQAPVNLKKRGEYLVNIMDCAACHTPKTMTPQGPVPDMTRYMMGYDAAEALPPLPDNVPIGPWALFKGDLTAAVGPWGTSYAGNITPDDTGIGSWTLEQFSNAIRKGMYKGLENTRPLMPPMPTQAYKNLSDEDVKAIFTYLKSLEPIENVVPAYTPPNA